MLRFGDVVMYHGPHRVFRGDREVALAPTEYRLLAFLLSHPTRAFSREEIVAAVWPEDRTIEARSVDVHIARLRRALAVDGQDDVIRTVRTVGYALG